MPDDNRLPTNQSLIDLKDSIDLLTANINRTASNIAYDSNLTIKAAIDGKVSKSGDTISGNLNIIGANLNVNRYTNGDTTIFAGGTISSGVSSSRGVIRLFHTNDKYVQIYPANTTENRNITLPDQTGTIALTSEITFRTLSRNAWNWNTVTSHSIEASSGNPVIVFGGRNGKGFMAICPANNSEVYTISNNIGCTISHTYDANTGKHTITFSNPTSVVGTSVVVTVIG